LAASIKEFLVTHGYKTPVVAVGKISTSESAEEIINQGKADLIGMARALLADPYWVKKVKEGREGDIVQCIYCNVCKALDENFKRVVCYLWPKGNLQAPLLTEERERPEWQSANVLKVSIHNGKIKLEWQAAEHFRKTRRSLRGRANKYSEKTVGARARDLESAREATRGLENVGAALVPRLCQSGADSGH